jgi:hypothetical protein
LVSAAVFSSLKPLQAIKEASSLGTIAFSETVLQEYAETLASNKFDSIYFWKKDYYFLKNLLQ